MLSVLLKYFQNHFYKNHNHLILFRKPLCHLLLFTCIHSITNFIIWLNFHINSNWASNESFAEFVPKELFLTIHANRHSICSVINRTSWTLWAVLLKIHLFTDEIEFYVCLNVIWNRIIETPNIWYTSNLLSSNLYYFLFLLSSTKSLTVLMSTVFQNIVHNTYENNIICMNSLPLLFY